MISDNNLAGNRSFSLDYLKVFMAVWIVAFHFVDKGTVNLNTEPVNFNWFVLCLCNLGGGIGNCVFVLLSGYFYYGKKFNFKRIIKMYSQIIFYSVMFFLLNINNSLLEVESGISVFPILSNRYWWVSNYLIICFFSPFLNVLMENLNEKLAGTLCSLCLLLFSILPSLQIDWIAGKSSVLIFITLYVIGATIKKYKVYEIIPQNRIRLCLVLMLVLEWGSQFVLLKIGFSNITYFTWGMEKTSVVITGILFVLFFLNLNLERNKIVDMIAASTLGIYIIHISCHDFLFKQLFVCKNVYTEWYMVLFLILTIIVIVTIATLIDKCVLFIIEYIMQQVIKYKDKQRGYFH